MSKETNDQLDNEFGIVSDENEVVDITPEKKKKSLRISDPKEDREKDYQFARAQLYDIVDKMQESLNEAMEVAAESQHPRAFEVCFNGAKAAADVVDKLSALHKSKKDLEIEEVKVQQHTNNTTNIMMTGSTAELLKMLKESNNK